MKDDASAQPACANDCPIAAAVDRRLVRRERGGGPSHGTHQQAAVDELGSAGPLRGEPSQRKVPSIATRAAFKRAAPSLAISGAPTSMPRLARHLQLRRTVQPFVNLEQAHLLGVGRERSFPDEFGWTLLQRLDALFYWTSNGPTSRIALPGDGTMADGSVLLYIEGPDDSHGSGLQHEFKLVLADDPALRRGQDVIVDVLDLLEQFYEHVVQLVVFPRVFTIMSAPPGSALTAAPHDKPALSAGSSR